MGTDPEDAKGHQSKSAQTRSLVSPFFFTQKHASAAFNPAPHASAAFYPAPHASDAFYSAPRFHYVKFWGTI